MSHLKPCWTQQHKTAQNCSRKGISDKRFKCLPTCEEDLICLTTCVTPRFKQEQCTCPMSPHPGGSDERSEEWADWPCHTSMLSCTPPCREAPETELLECQQWSNCFVHESIMWVTHLVSPNVHEFPRRMTTKWCRNLVLEVQLAFHKEQVCTCGQLEV